jgi:gas vesicle protein
MSENNNAGNGGRMLAAFLGGVAVGAGVVWFTSPRSGRENREHVAELARSGRDRAKSLPHATSAAASAAKEAFNETLEQQQKS